MESLVLAVASMKPPIFTILASVLVCAPLNVLWLILDNDSWAKIGYLALTIAVLADFTCHLKASKSEAPSDNHPQRPPTV